MKCIYCEDKGYWYSYDGFSYACEECEEGRKHKDEERPYEPSKYTDI